METPLSAILSTLSGLDFTECKNVDSIPILREAIIKEIVKEMVSQINLSVEIDNKDIQELLRFSVIFLEFLSNAQMPAKSLSKVQDSLCLAIVSFSNGSNKDDIEKIVYNWKQFQLIQEQTTPKETEVTIVKGKKKEPKTIELKEQPE